LRNAAELPSSDQPDAARLLLIDVAPLLQTDRLIAMGIPSEGMEGQFRNPMSEVIRFFDTKHPNAAKVRSAHIVHVTFLD
jgi:hypothetical protein